MVERHLMMNSEQRPTQTQVALFIAVQLNWNAVVAYVLLVLLPVCRFRYQSGAILLFQPDVGLIAVMHLRDRVRPIEALLLPDWIKGDLACLGTCQIYEC